MYYKSGKENRNRSNAVTLGESGIARLPYNDLCGLGFGFQALHADFSLFMSPVNNFFNGSQVRKNDPEADIVGMRYGSSSLRMFSTDFTCFRHNFLNNYCKLLKITGLVLQKHPIFVTLDRYDTTTLGRIKPESTKYRLWLSGVSKKSWINSSATVVETLLQRLFSYGAACSGVGCAVQGVGVITCIIR